MTAADPASAESARFPFSVLTQMKPEEEALKRIMGARRQAALAAGKNSRTKCCQALTAAEREQDYRFHERAAGCGPSRAASHLRPTAALRADAASGSELSLFLVGHVRPFSAGEIDQKILDLSLPNLA